MSDRTHDKIDEIPAYPIPCNAKGYSWRPYKEGFGGMTLKDRVALEVLPTLIEDDISLGPDQVASEAFDYAEGFMRQREKNNGDTQEETDLSNLMMEVLDERSPKELLKWAEEEYPEFMEAVDQHVEQEEKTTEPKQDERAVSLEKDQKKTCAWIKNEDIAAYNTHCGHKWYNPRAVEEDDDFKCCPFCGRGIVVFMMTNKAMVIEPPESNIAFHDDTVEVVMFDNDKGFGRYCSCQEGDRVEPDIAQFLIEAGYEIASIPPEDQDVFIYWLDCPDDSLCWRPKLSKNESRVSQYSNLHEVVKNIDHHDHFELASIPDVKEKDNETK